MSEQQTLIDKKDAFKYAFNQQILPAWTPIINMRNTIPIFFLTGIIFITIGIVLQSFSNKIKQYRVNYSDLCSNQNQNTCQVILNITDQIQSPVFFYIELTNFYQNHRLYVSSKDVNQLSNQTQTQTNLASNCQGALTNQDMGQTLAYDKITPLIQNNNANPCGLIAKINLNNKSTTGIAWPYDKSTLYQNDYNWQKTQWLDKTDERQVFILIRFINWMRVAALPTFRKLWGRIDQSMQGKYQLNIVNNYPTTIFGGKKSIIFSNANEFGGTNVILSSLYLAFGTLSVLISLIFLIKERLSIKKNNNQDQ